MKSKNLIHVKAADCIFLLLLFGLLVLRFPFLIMLCCDKDKMLLYNNILITYNQGIDIFAGGTYIMTAAIIFIKRNSLADYNIDLFSLIIFMTAPVFELFSKYSLPMISNKNSSWLRIGISVCLFIALLIQRPKINRRSAKDISLWVLIAVVTGICSGVLAGKVSTLQDPSRSPDSPTMLIIICGFFIQLGNAAILEEPLFRGFLWGFLKKFHWNDYWIWIFQAILFMLGHFYYFGVANYSFWIIVPMGALIFGLVAWRSKSIGMSMIVHGLYNNVADIVAHYTL